MNAHFTQLHRRHGLGKIQTLIETHVNDLKHEQDLKHNKRKLVMINSSNE